MKDKESGMEFSIFTETGSKLFSDTKLRQLKLIT